MYKWLDQWATKKNVALAALACVAVIIFLNQIENTLCTTRACFDALDLIFANAWILISVLILAVVMTFVQKKVFQTWVRFAVWYIPMSIIFISIAPSTDANLLAPPTREIAAVFFPASFVLISISIVTWKYLRS